MEYTSEQIRESCEKATFRRLINDLYPTGIVSIVSDTWDFWKVISEYTVELKDEILARDGKVVFRPDSGDPVDIICGIKTRRELATTLKGAPTNLEEWSEWAAEDLHEKFTDELVAEDPIFSIEEDYMFGDILYNVEYSPDLNRYDKQYYYVDNYGSILSKCKVTKVNLAERTPSQKGAIEVLWDIFGGTVNEKGYKTLNQKVGLIYGDSITLARQEEILAKLAAKGFASDNIVFGIGSFSYQYNTRDTFGFAMKATYGEVDGVGREIFKDPKTDSGTKKSARGMLQVFNNRADAQGNDLMFDGKDELVLNDQCTAEQEAGGLLEVMFEDGKIVKETSLAEIRERLNE